MAITVFGVIGIAFDLLVKISAPQKFDIGSSILEIQICSLIIALNASNESITLWIVMSFVGHSVVVTPTKRGFHCESASPKTPPKYFTAAGLLFFSSLVSFSDFSHLIREERRRDCAQAAPGRDWRDARRRGLELKHTTTMWLKHA